MSDQRRSVCSSFQRIPESWIRLDPTGRHGSGNTVEPEMEPLPEYIPGALVLLRNGTPAFEDCHRRCTRLPKTIRSVTVSEDRFGAAGQKTVEDSVQWVVIDKLQVLRHEAAPFPTPDPSRVRKPKTDECSLRYEEPPALFGSARHFAEWARTPHSCGFGHSDPEFRTQNSQNETVPAIHFGFLAPTFSVLLLPAEVVFWQELPDRVGQGHHPIPICCLRPGTFPTPRSGRFPSSEIWHKISCTLILSIRLFSSRSKR